ncbi:hypothetical protein [uncultured Lactobacillus sp.]|uniref:hypothetical protein n=1 Tax=uncultured Lactobacillus sp. TaxID=153152 RepID=UPI002617F66C|nr:hypothetical protein [uncultured Lactobacillus sp.]
MLTHERFDDLLEQVQQLLPKRENDTDGRYKTITVYALNKTIQDVANFCNIPIDELPEELDYTLVAMTVQVVKTHGWLDPENDSSNVQSLNEGDTSVTFKSITSIFSELQAVNPITDNYTNILYNFRRLPE